MPELGQMLYRSRRVVGLFMLMVLLPASIFGVLIVRAVRGERLRFEYEQTQRQRHVVRLVETDLRTWLFSRDPGAAVSESLLRFRVDGDRIVFPQFELSLPSSGPPRTLPLASTPSSPQPDTQSVAHLYYPRIQSFLRDLNAGRNSGAQYFLRLRALVVSPPGNDRGYVVDVQPVVEHVNRRLADYCAGESFSGTLWVADGPNKSPSAAAAFALEGFPFFHLVFNQDAARLGDLRPHTFPYSMALLGVVTVLGSIFMHRAISHELRLSQLRSDFVAAVSHEFRSPLSSILALSERLESIRVRDPERLAEYHQIIGRDARRLSALVTRLLDFAQIEEGKKVYSFERVELVAIVRDAIEACRHLASPDRIQPLDQNAGPLWVRADRTAVQHCIQNLIENALKYSPPESPVTVACARSDGSALVDVQDAGIGIPLAEREKIFEKFYRGSRATELNAQGVGIGLALVKHVVVSHGGSVAVESEPGRGSRFRLRLPSLEA